jgi:hypothetical protein
VRPLTRILLGLYYSDIRSENSWPVLTVPDRGATVLWSVTAAAIQKVGFQP